MPDPSQLQLSQRFFELLKAFEGFRPEPYNDPAGHATIGYGHLLHKGNVTQADRDLWGSISEDRAKELAYGKLQEFENAVKSLGVPMSQEQYDGLVSFTYNLGPGWTKGSNLANQIRASDWGGAAETMKGYNKAKDAKTGQMVALPGLTSRRNQEAGLLLQAEAPPPPPPPAAPLQNPFAPTLPPAIAAAPPTAPALEAAPMSAPTSTVEPLPFIGGGGMSPIMQVPGGPVEETEEERKAREAREAAGRAGYDLMPLQTERKDAEGNTHIGTNVGQGITIWLRPDGTSFSRPIQGVTPDAQVAGPVTRNIGGRVMGWNPTTSKFDIDHGPVAGPEAAQAELSPYTDSKTGRTTWTDKAALAAGREPIAGWTVNGKFMPNPSYTGAAKPPVAPGAPVAPGSPTGPGAPVAPASPNIQPPAGAMPPASRGGARDASGMLVESTQPTAAGTYSTTRVEPDAEGGRSIGTSGGYATGPNSITGLDIPGMSIRDQYGMTTRYDSASDMASGIGTNSFRGGRGSINDLRRAGYFDSANRSTPTDYSLGDDQPFQPIPEELRGLLPGYAGGGEIITGAGGGTIYPTNQERRTMGLERLSPNHIPQSYRQEGTNQPLPGQTAADAPGGMQPYWQPNGEMTWVKGFSRGSPSTYTLGPNASPENPLTLRQPNRYSEQYGPNFWAEYGVNDRRGPAAEAPASVNQWGVGTGGDQPLLGGGSSGGGSTNPYNIDIMQLLRMLLGGGTPQMAGGGQMMLNEPTVGMGMMSGQPQFIAGEAGPEAMTITPMGGGAQPPSMGMEQAPGAMRDPGMINALVHQMFMPMRGANRPKAMKPVGSTY